MEYRSRPLYWLNAKLEPDELRAQIRAMREECGFGGFAPLTLHSARPEYLTEEYFDRYRLMLEEAESLGLKVIFYDDINFPTGTAGGRLAERHPGSLLFEDDFRGDLDKWVNTAHATTVSGRDVNHPVLGDLRDFQQVRLSFAGGLGFLDLLRLLGARGRRQTDGNKQ